MGAGPLGVPSSNPGTQAKSLSQMRTAIETLQSVLSEFPIGSEPHKAILNAIKSLSAHAAPSTEVPGQQQVELRNLTAQAGKNANIAQLMRSLGAGGSPPGAGVGAAPGGIPGQPPGMTAPAIPGGTPGAGAV